MDANDFLNILSKPQHATQDAISIATHSSYVMSEPTMEVAQPYSKSAIIKENNHTRVLPDYQVAFNQSQMHLNNQRHPQVDLMMGDSAPMLPPFHTNDRLLQLPPLDFSKDTPMIQSDPWPLKSESSDSQLSTPEHQHAFQPKQTVPSNAFPAFPRSTAGSLAGFPIRSNFAPYDPASVYSAEYFAMQQPRRPHPMPYYQPQNMMSNMAHPLMTTFHAKTTNQASKRYRCNICGKGFSRPSSLTTHTYSHTGEKPFKCTVEGCGRQFSVVSNLRRHGKVHANQNNASSSASSSSSSSS
jgi:uncharacterized Zn-finger protein